MLSAIFIAPSTTLTTAAPGPLEIDFTTPRSSYEGFEKVNMHYWLAEYAGFLEFWFVECLPEPTFDQATRGWRSLGAGHDGRRR